MYPGVDFLSNRMTVGLFNSYLERLPLHRTERMMDMAQSALYAQMTTNSRQRTWKSWAGLVSKINMLTIHRDAITHKQNPITWNGQVISIKELVKKFATTFGKRSVVS